METHTPQEPSLTQLRTEIDRIDRELFSLIARRMTLAGVIGDHKRARGLPIRDPVREAQLKARLKEFATGVLEPRHVEELAAVLIRISRDLQAPATEGR
jgi:chorismate mutase